MTWVAALFGALALLVGLRDTPRQLLGNSLAGRPDLAASSAPRGELCLEVVETQGRPVGGARAFAYSETANGSFASAGSLITGGDGRGCFSDVPLGTVWVLADAPRHARASTQLVLDAKRSVRLVLPDASALTVRVTDELAAPLPAATVLVTASDPLPYGLLTDADGKAQFSWLAPAPWSVRVAAPGYESVSRTGVLSDLVVSLRRLAAIDVRVVDSGGASVAGANVLIAGSSLWPARLASADAGGLARIRGLSAGSYDLRAVHGSDVSEALVGFELARGAHESVTLRLTPGRMVSAVVTDGDSPSPVVVANADVVLVEGGVGSFPLRGRTGTDGTVTLGPISRGPATLAASAADFVPGQPVSVPEVVTSAIRIPLAKGGTLRGEVVDARGAPIGGASIEVVGTDRYGMPIAQTPQTQNFRASHFEWALSGPPSLIPAGELGVMPGPVPPIPPFSGSLGESATLPAAGPSPSLAELTPWVTRATGDFIARPIMPGRVRALVRHPEFVEGASELVTLAAGGEAEVRIVLLRGGSLEGRVVDERGFPVSGVEVEVVAERGTFERSTITASDGAFAFAAVPDKVLVSVARPLDRARIALRKRLDVEEGERKRVELVVPAPRDPVRIVVVDDRAVPVELAEVRATSLDPAVPLKSTLFTDSTGGVELSDARGLPLRLVVEAPRFARLESSVDAAPGEIKLALDPGVLVTGRVTAVRGRRAVAGAVVTLRVGAQRSSTMSDADGAYRFGSVPATHVELSFSHPDYAEAHASADIERTTRADRPFELPAVDLAEPGEIQGEVVDDHGRPVEGARVTIGIAPAYLPAGALPEGVVLSNESGQFTLKGVHPGSVRVSAHASGIGRGSVDGISVESGRSTSRVTIRLTERVGNDDALAPASLAVTLAERGSADTLEVRVVAVAAGSEAERSGLLPGDVIRALDGEKPSSMADARARLAGREGSDLVLDLERAGVALRVRVTRESVRR